MLCVHLVFLVDLDMIRQTRKCCVVYAKGFTLVEVLVVVIIIGVLSSMGVAGLQGAVQNNRVRDAAVNVAAFLEKASTIARQTSDSLCVEAANGSSTITLRKTAGGCQGDVVESMNLEGGVFFRSSASGVSSPVSGATTNLSGKSAYFIPRLGLNSFRGSNLSDQSNEGYFLMQYTTSGKWAGVAKVPTDNRFRSYTYNGGWSAL